MTVMGDVCPGLPPFGGFLKSIGPLHLALKAFPSGFNGGVNPLNPKQFILLNILAMPWLEGAYIGIAKLKPKRGEHTCRK